MDFWYGDRRRIQKENNRTDPSDLIKHLTILEIKADRSPAIQKQITLMQER